MLTLFTPDAVIAEAFRLTEEPPKPMAKGKMRLAVPGCYACK